MDNRIKKLIKNQKNVRVSREEKKERLEKFTNELIHLVVKMNEALQEIGADCKLSLLPENDNTNQLILKENKTGNTIYSIRINNDIQTLNIGFEKEETLKTYYISLNEDILIENIYNRNSVDLEDILMVDLKRIIEMNNF